MTSRLRHSPRLLPPVVAAVLAVGAGCSQGEPTTAAPSTAATSRAASATSSTSPTPEPRTSSQTTSPRRTTTAPSTTATKPAPSCAERIVARLSPSQRAGQLLMVGVHPSSSSSALARQVAAQQLGAVIFLGGWHSGAADVRAVATRLQSAATAGARSTRGVGGLLVAADQEGGQVQQLRGPGFTRLPSARAQASLGTVALQRRATSWAGELKRAGVNVNLAPVADTVPASLGDGNAPIGALDRDFVPGSPSANSRYAAAFVRGALAGGVAPAAKHFPGIGRLRSNTDFSSAGITDPVTTATDPYLAPFRAAIGAGTPLVMVSSARYPKIDAERQAMFSRTVVSGLLRARLGFRGVVITDDVGAAESVASVPVGERATRFVAAGGDIVLTAQPSQAPTMVAALVERAAAQPAFAAQLRASAGRVVALKVRLGLASCAS